MSTTQEVIINVQEIEPRFRHAAIFQTFDELAEGESLIIHNNHDPVPVYYQLQEMQGDIFTWEYLQQGPEWWDIRVTKKNISHQSTYTNETGDIVINVPSIEPRFKHSTIFQSFENLHPGKSMIIHNNHDPKPVYYQLQEMHGNVFIWEYLQQGPQWWDIRVTKKGSGTIETIGQIVAKDFGTTEIFKRYGIDFCCGGRKTVQEICKEKGIDPEIIEKELHQPKQNIKGTYHNYNEWNLDFLVDFIINTHHNYIRKHLPEIQGYAIKVAQVHGGHHPELITINNTIQEAGEDLMEHLESEEKYLFPLVKELVQVTNAGAVKSNPKIQALETFIAKHLEEHDNVGNEFDEIRELSNNFAISEDSCASYKLLYKMLEEFEDDLHIHIALENNILFPKAIEISKSLV